MNLPQIASLEFDTSAVTSISTGTVHAILDWDFDAGDFRRIDGKTIELTGIDYVKVWCKKALLTVKDSLIYSGTDYGSEHFSLIGRNFNSDYFQSELKRTISEALMKNDAITGVNGFEFVQDKSRLTVSLIVQSIYGATSEAVKI